MELHLTKTLTRAITVVLKLASQVPLLSRIRKRIVAEKINVVLVAEYIQFLFL